MAVLALFLPVLAAPAWAHEVRPAILEINEGPPGRYAVRLRQPTRGGEARRGLNLKVRFPAHCAAPGPEQTEQVHTTYSERTLTERFEVHCPGGIERRAEVPEGAEHLDGAESAATQGETQHIGTQREMQRETQGTDTQGAATQRIGTQHIGMQRGTQPGAESADMQAETQRTADMHTVRIEGLRESITDVYVTFRPAFGAPQNFLLNGAQPAFYPGGDARPEGAAWFRLGVAHLLGGFDHVLFVLGLLLLASSTLRLVLEVTAFTLAHSITLALATLEWLHPRTGPVEAGISLSILFLAFELTRPRAARPSLARRHPELIAFGFGLLHGLGFAGALAQTGLPEGAILPALFFFNLGIEAGQLLVVAGFGALLLLLGRAGDAWPARGRAVLVAVLGTCASYFFIGSLVNL